MKNLQITLILVVIVMTILMSCKSSEEDDKQTNISSDTMLSEIPEVRMGNFYADSTNESNSVVLADTIIYYTVIKNPDPEDDWQEQCLSRLNRKALANIVFNAIYNGRLTPYNFKTESPMTIEEVKALDKENPRSQIAKMEFTEEWYFNETDLTFSKRVNSIMLGYERRSSEGEVKYTAGVKVYLTGAKKKIEKI
jgi:hypothetical protein